MNTASQLLVIILSIALALFLILSIVVAIQVIRILKIVQDLTRKAEQIMDSAERVGSLVKNVSGPLSAVKLIFNIIESVTNHKKKRTKNEG